MQHFVQWLCVSSNYGPITCYISAQFWEGAEISAWLREQILLKAKLQLCQESFNPGRISDISSLVWANWAANFSLVKQAENSHVIVIESFIPG